MDDRPGDDDTIRIEKHKELHNRTMRYLIPTIMCLEAIICNINFKPNRYIVLPAVLFSYFFLLSKNLQY